MRQLWALLLIVCGLGPAVGDSVARSQAQPASGSPDISTRAIVDAAAAYVKEYQDQLTSILADEVYTQQIVSQMPRDSRMPRSRSLRSEMFFMFAPDDRGWMAIRDVLALDGKPIDDRPDLRSALRTLPAAQVASTFKSYNSRFNVGRVVRNFNEPILSLLVLDSSHRGRFSFDRKHVERKAGAVFVTLTFVETATPTLIRDLAQRPVFSKGELTVQAGTGHIRQAVLTLTIGSVWMELHTQYAAEGRLGIWVPTIFRERYQDSVAHHDTKVRLLNTATPHELIECEARYTNYRRFEVSSRIK